MALIDVVEWSPQNNAEFAYRFPHSNLSTGTQLGANSIPSEDLKLIDQAFSSMVQDSYSSGVEHNEYQERVYTEICKLWKAGCQHLKQI